MKLFLTGATGFIGQPLTQALLRRGWEILALVRQPESRQSLALMKMGVQCIRGDITDPETLREGMTGAEIVVHNAGWYEIGIPEKARQQMYAINVTGTGNVLGLALELGILRTVYISSVTNYGETGSEARDETYQRQAPYKMWYEQTKAEAHKIAQQYQQRGLPLILVCPAHVVGPNDPTAYGYFQRMHVNRLMPPVAWAADTIHSPVHVEDVAEGIALAVEKGHPGETYILAGEPTRVRQIFQIWAENPGGYRVKAYLPFWLAELLSTVLEPVQRRLQLPAIVSREAVRGTKGSYHFSSAKAQRELGWSYRPAREMWANILEEEMNLVEGRRKRDILSRIKPVELMD